MAKGFRKKQEVWIEETTKEHESVIQIAKEQHEIWSEETKKKINESLTMEMADRFKRTVTIWTKRKKKTMRK